jgi:hypothetical protein
VDPTDPDPGPQHCSIVMNYKNRRYIEVTRNKQDITVKNAGFFLIIPPIQDYEEMISRFLFLTEKNNRNIIFLTSYVAILEKIGSLPHNILKIHLAFLAVRHQRFVLYQYMFYI